MKTFEGLKSGTIITNPVDGEMMVCYSDAFSEDNEKVLCLADSTSVYPAWQFDPKDWSMKE